LKKLLSLLVILCISAPAYAQQNTSRSSLWNDVPQNSTNCKIGPCAAPYVGAPPLGYQQFTVAAATFLPSIPAGATEALVICTGQTVNWRDDGTAPTATVGMPLAVNTAFPYTGGPASGSNIPLSAIEFIQTTATATCNVSYYK